VVLLAGQLDAAGVGIDAHHVRQPPAKLAGQQPLATAHVDHPLGVGRDRGQDQLVVVDVVVPPSRVRHHPLIVHRPGSVADLPHPDRPAGSSNDRRTTQRPHRSNSGTTGCLGGPEDSGQWI
jgi:hypothetical protein